MCFAMNSIKAWLARVADCELGSRKGSEEQ
jgi:hypothetical protein